MMNFDREHSSILKEKEYKLIVKLNSDLNNIINCNRYDKYERSKLYTIQINILTSLIRLLNIKSLQTLCKKGEAEKSCSSTNQKS